MSDAVPLSPPHTTPATSAATRAVLVATSGAAVMGSLDLFVVNVAFDDIGRSLGVGQPGGPSVAALSWVLNAYAVTFAALLVPFGRLADRFGQRRVFLAGLVVFTAASAACAVGVDVGLLVGFRVLQAAGAAAMTPTSLGLLLAALPPERRAAAVRRWAAIGALAAAVGPSVGGVLTQFGWEWVFLVNVPIGIALVTVTLRGVPDTRPHSDSPVPDLLGAGLLAGSVGLLALGLTETPTWGWVDARTVSALVAAVLLALGFAARSARHHSPVIPPSLLAVASFRWSAVAMVAFNVGFGANLLVGILWMQQGWGYSALVTGLAIAPGPVMVPLTVSVAHRYLGRVSPVTLVAVGCVVMAVGAGLRAVVMGDDPAYLTGFLPGWILGGIGVGLAMPNLMAGATHDLAPDQSATGSGIITMSRQIGFVVGVSILFALVGDRVGLAATGGFRATWWVCVGAAVLTAVLAVGTRPARARQASTDDPAPATKPTATPLPDGASA